MRLLIINPNTSKGATARIKEAADGVAYPGDEFTTLCPAFGPELIVTQADADHASIAVVETVKAYDAPCDGIILAGLRPFSCCDRISRWSALRRPPFP